MVPMNIMMVYNDGNWGFLGSEYIRQVSAKSLLRSLFSRFSPRIISIVVARLRSQTLTFRISNRDALKQQSLRLGGLVEIRGVEPLTS